MKNFNYDDKNKVYIQNNFKSNNEFQGSEEYIYDIFCKNNNIDSYSVDLQKYIKDFKSKLYLSHTRTNLLEGIKELFNENSSVLEIGGNMGELSLWFSDNFKNVDSIEFNEKKALSIVKRSGNRENIRIFEEDVNKIEFPEDSYNLISAIDILSNMHSNLKNENQGILFIDFLKNVSDHLDEKGVFVLSCDNKLGIKYFSGCKEEYTKKFGESLMDYPSSNSPISFSRNEMEDILREAGFKNIQFYHAFPGFQFTETLIKEDKEIYNEEILDLIKTEVKECNLNREHLFMDSLFIKSLIKAKILHQHSNSFLVVCSKDDKLNLKTNWLVKKFNNNENMKPIFHYNTLLKHEDNKLEVERKPIKYGIDKAHMGNVKFNINNKIEYNKNTLMIEAHESILKENKYDNLANILKEVLQNALSEYGLKEKDKDGYPLLSGEAIDYCLWNLVREDNGKLTFIDKKWENVEPVSSDFILFRSIMYLFLEVFPFVSENKLSEFTIKIMNNIYENYNIERFNKNLKEESKFQTSISIEKISIEDYEFNEDDKCYEIKLSNIINERNELRNDFENINKENENLKEENKNINKKLKEKNENLKLIQVQIEKLRSEMVEKNYEIKKLKHSLEDIYNSTAWKVISKFHKITKTNIEREPEEVKRLPEMSNTNENINNELNESDNSEDKKNEQNENVEKLLNKFNFEDEERELRINDEELKKAKGIKVKNSKISIIIPVRQINKNLEYNLYMLSNQKGFKNIEIFVIDTLNKKELSELCNKYRCIEINTNKELYENKNEAVKRAKGDYILLLEEGSIINSILWINEAHEEIIKSKSDCLLICKNSIEGAKDYFYRIMKNTKFKVLSIKKGNKTILSDDFKKEIKNRFKFDISYGAALVKKQAISNVKFKLNYIEDLELIEKIIKNNKVMISKDLYLERENKTPYYLLKEGYNKGLEISKFSSDFKKPKVKFDDCIKDIMFNYDVITRVVLEKIELFNEPYNLNKAYKEFEKQVKKATKEGYPDFIDVDINNYIDDNFKELLNKLYKEYVHQDRIFEYNGALLKSTKEIVERSIESFQNDENVDKSKLDKIIYSIYKQYAIMCGLNLAYVYDENNKLSKDIHEQLTK